MLYITLSKLKRVEQFVQILVNHSIVEKKLKFGHNRLPKIYLAINAEKPHKIKKKCIFELT